MKNGCNEILEAKIAERNERAKKLYRYVSDVARRVGEATTESRSVVDLFSNHIEIQRQKLRDNCEKLLFLDPLNYGKKSLELLWRKVYYDTVNAAKKLRESDNTDDSYLFSHLVCGIGHFHHFITRIQTDMKIHIKEIDYVSLYKDDEVDETNEKCVSEEELQFGRLALYTCLIYLGDLSRYQTELFQAYAPSIAARYYLQAANIDMSSGMPFNQLGNLYLDRNYNLDSVCYYIHCLSCLSPFEGALGNLTKIFEKNAQYCDSLSDPDTLTQAEHIQNTVANFLSLIEIWYLCKNDTNIPQRCSKIAQDLKMTMDFAKTELPDINKNYSEHTQAIEEESNNPSDLTHNLIYKMVQICLFTLAKMIETDEIKAFACKAFTLALLSQLLQKLVKQLESLGLKNPACKYRARTKSVQEYNQTAENEQVDENLEEKIELPPEIVVTNGNHENASTENLPDENLKRVLNGDAKTGNKKLLAKRRRRRRVASSDSSDMSDLEAESTEADTNESCSDEENLSQSTLHSEDESKSEESCDGSDIESAVKCNGNNETITEEKIKVEEVNGNTKLPHANKNIDNDGIKKEQNKDLNAEEIQSFLLGNNFLSSIKLLQDWALTEKDLILSCRDSAEAMFQSIADLLNIFTYYFYAENTALLNNKECKILDYAKRVGKNLKLEYKTIPLPEDVNLRGTTICKFDKDAAEWQILERYKPTIYEENIIRILNFIDFGNQMAKIVPQIRFNRSLKIFYLKKTTPPKLNTKINHKRSREWHNSKKQHVESSDGGLLHRLGRLWLASQVSELERSGQVASPALLALDSAALNKHLRRVKQLLRARNFILLVPTIVLQELDDLKREQSTARDAIRWLEIQLKSGSRFLRAQRPGQSRPLPLLKYPRKAPPHVHNFIQILEFCNHFIGDEKQTQGGNGDPDHSLNGKSTPLLILLVGCEPGSEEEQYKEFSLTGAAQSAGISIEHIADFYSKWRQTAHKSSKKR